MRNRGLLLIVAAILSAVIAGVLVFNISNVPVSQVAPPVVIATVTAIPTEQVVVARIDIPIRHVVTAADVVTRVFPLGVAPVTAIHVLSDVVSTTATTAIFGGQVLDRRQFSQAAVVGGASTTLPAGKVLVAFPAADILDQAGAVRAGDRVDILLTLPVSGTTTINSSSAPAQQPAAGAQPVVQATMQNIEVYTTGEFTPGGGGGAVTGNGGIFTFVVDHQEALILKFIKDSGGTIDLVVRSQAETKPVTTDPVSLDYIVDLFQFVIVKPR